MIKLLCIDCSSDIIDESVKWTDRGLFWVGFLGLIISVIVAGFTIKIVLETIQQKKIMLNQNYYNSLQEYVGVLEERLKNIKTKPVIIREQATGIKIDGLSFYDRYKYHLEYFATKDKANYNNYLNRNSEIAKGNINYYILAEKTYRVFSKFFGELSSVYSDIIRIFKSEQFQKLEKWQKEVIYNSIKHRLLSDYLRLFENANDEINNDILFTKEQKEMIRNSINRNFSFDFYKITTAIDEEKKEIIFFDTILSLISGTALNLLYDYIISNNLGEYFYSTPEWEEVT